MLVTQLHRFGMGLAQRELFLDPLKYDHVGIHGHTDTENDTRYTGHGQRTAKLREDGESEQYVQCQRDIGNDTGSIIIYQHQQEDDQERNAEGLNRAVYGFLSQCRSYQLFLHYFGRRRELTGFQDVGQVGTFLGSEGAGDLGPSVRYHGINGRSGMYIIVQYDSDRSSDIFSCQFCPFVGTFLVHFQGDHRCTALLLKIEPGIAHVIAFQLGGIFIAGLDGIQAYVFYRCVLGPVRVFTDQEPDIITEITFDGRNVIEEIQHFFGIAFFKNTYDRGALHRLTVLVYRRHQVGKKTFIPLFIFQGSGIRSGILQLAQATLQCVFQRILCAGGILRLRGGNFSGICGLLCDSSGIFSFQAFEIGGGCLIGLCEALYDLGDGIYFPELKPCGGLEVFPYAFRVFDACQLYGDDTFGFVQVNGRGGDTEFIDTGREDLMCSVDSVPCFGTYDAQHFRVAAV